MVEDSEVGVPNATVRRMFGLRSPGRQTPASPQNDAESDVFDPEIAKIWRKLLTSR